MKYEIPEFTSERNTVIEWLEINKKFPKRSNSAFDYIGIIRGGLKSKSVNSFIKHSSLTQKQVSRMIHISERTLQRNPPEKIIDTTSSERLIDLTRLFHKGITVFNEKAKFITWLNRPNRALDNQKPIELIETNMGIDLVIDELLRIEHGVFS
jgi:putative toxin-antitoxin system antitoxin component (TIGR02293 family)